MNKTELMENCTMEQLADMVIKLQNTSEAKNDEIHKMKWQIGNLEEINGRLQAKIDTYNNYILPRCTKEAKELTDHNNFSEVRIVSVEQEKKCDCGKEEIYKLNCKAEKYRKAFEEAKKERDAKICEYQNKIDELKQKLERQTAAIIYAEEYVRSLKNDIRRKETAINQIDDILYELFGVKHDIVREPEKFKEILQEKIENNETIADLLPTEPIKVADMLINASKKRTNCMTGEEYDKYIFEKWQLHQIAEHLLVFCNNKTNCEYQIPDADSLYPDKVSYIKEMEEYVRRLKSDLENK